MLSANAWPSLSILRARCLWGLALLSPLLGCSPDASSVRNDPAAALRVGVLPDRSQPALMARYGPLLEYLESALEREMELVVPSSYAELLDSFDRGQVELAWLGGLTFVQAESRSQARPLVMRDVDLEFTSDFLVASNAPETSIEELAGQSFSFGPRLSTSGHLMPRYFLVQRGIEPETHFASVRYSMNHEQTASWVAEGEAAIGVANSFVVEEMFRDGRLSPDSVRVLERTMPFNNYVWAVPANLDQGLRDRLLIAFLALDPTSPQQATVLSALGAGGLLPASSQDFDEVRTAAATLGLLREQVAP